VALIHHPVLHREVDVPDTTVPIWTGEPGWVRGPLPIADPPVDESNPSPVGGRTEPPLEED
jgi:hypothetical protein